MVIASDGVAESVGTKSAATKPTDSGATDSTAAKAPALRTRVVMNDLDIPWDIAVLPNGSWLVTERDRERILLRRADGSQKVLADTPPGFWHSGETGLMSVVADPNVKKNHRFYTCTGFDGAGEPDIRVIAWRLNKNFNKARRVETLLKGIQTVSGRHGGCRLRFDPAGRMYVGTGDAAVTENPQSLTSLNGKVLRMDRFTGKPYANNPWGRAANENKRYIWNYGHRNVQGLAWREADGRMWSVEHGTYRDDEVNRGVKGGNYGWQPGPNYDESPPMTDYSLPGKQIGAKWSSGDPTIATSGATWVHGKKWGAYEDTLAVCALAGERLLFMKFSKKGKLKWVRTPGALNGDFGRLRSVTQDRHGNLLVATANGGGADRIIRVRPA